MNNLNNLNNLSNNPINALNKEAYKVGYILNTNNKQICSFVYKLDSNLIHLCVIQYDAWSHKYRFEFLHWFSMADCSAVEHSCHMDYLYCHFENMNVSGVFSLNHQKTVYLCIPMAEDEQMFSNHIQKYVPKDKGSDLVNVNVCSILLDVTINFFLTCFSVLYYGIWLNCLVKPKETESQVNSINYINETVENNEFNNQSVSNKIEIVDLRNDKGVILPQVKRNSENNLTSNIQNINHYNQKGDYSVNSNNNQNNNLQEFMTFNKTNKDSNFQKPKALPKESKNHFVEFLLSILYHVYHALMFVYYVLYLVYYVCYNGCVQGYKFSVDFRRKMIERSKITDGHTYMPDIIVESAINHIPQYNISYLRGLVHSWMKHEDLPKSFISVPEVNEKEEVEQDQQRQGQGHEQSVNLSNSDSNSDQSSQQSPRTNYQSFATNLDDEKNILKYKLASNPNNILQKDKAKANSKSKKPSLQIYSDKEKSLLSFDRNLLDLIENLTNTNMHYKPAVKLELLHNFDVMERQIAYPYFRFEYAPDYQQNVRDTLYIFLKQAGREFFTGGFNKPGAVRIPFIWYEQEFNSIYPISILDFVYIRQSVFCNDFAEKLKYLMVASFSNLKFYFKKSKKKIVSLLGDTDVRHEKVTNTMVFIDTIKSALPITYLVNFQNEHFEGYCHYFMSDVKSLNSFQVNVSLEYYVYFFESKTVLKTFSSNLEMRNQNIFFGSLHGNLYGNLELNIWTGISRADYALLKFAKLTPDYRGFVFLGYGYHEQNKDYDSLYGTAYNIRGEQILTFQGHLIGEVLIEQVKYYDFGFDGFNPLFEHANAKEFNLPCDVHNRPCYQLFHHEDHDVFSNQLREDMITDIHVRGLLSGTKIEIGKY